jgi:hypothetical protein
MGCILLGRAAPNQFTRHIRAVQAKGPALMEVRK